MEITFIMLGRWFRKTKSYAFHCSHAYKVVQDEAGTGIQNLKEQLFIKINSSYLPWISGDGQVFSHFHFVWLKLKILFLCFFLQ